jgi:hypothetical protein
VENYFSYTVLQYIHSNILEERVNLGILFYFPKQVSPFTFVFPKNVDRIKYLYPAVNVKKIRLYLESISDTVRSINESFNTSLFHQEFELSKFIDSEILKNDDSALWFSTLHNSILYADDPRIIVNEIFAEYFPAYGHKENSNSITEHQISNRYLSLLRSKSPIVESKIIKNYKLTRNDFNFSFDYAWQNGTLNLVKPITFDLVDTNAIQHKSVLWYGNLSLLKLDAEEKNIRFDLLIAEPTEKAVFKEYSNALKTIDLAPVNKRIIEYNQIEEYSDSTISNLTLAK